MEAIFPRVKPAEREQEQVTSNPPQFYERTHDLDALKSSEDAPLRTSRGVFTGHVTYVPSSTDLLEAGFSETLEELVVNIEQWLKRNPNTPKP